MHLQIFQHVPFEGAGAIADWAVSRGYTVDTTHWYQLGATAPDPQAVDFLVVMGGPMSVHDTQTLPWLTKEKAFLRAYTALGKPMIGVCLGAQLLAETLGGKVTQNTFEEIGWFPVELTPEARALWPGLPATLTPLHWHGETFSLPQGATLLLHNSTCRNQGFLANGNQLGLQCHIEANELSTRAFIDSCPDGEVPNPGNSPFVTSAEAILEGEKQHGDAVRAALFVMLDTIATRGSSPADNAA